MDILAVISIPFGPNIYSGAVFILSLQSFLIVVAVMVAAGLTRRWAHNYGLNTVGILSVLATVLAWCIICGIIGARIFQVIDFDIIQSVNVTLAWHGFLTLVAVAVAVYLTWRWGRRDGLNGDAILSVSTWCIIGGIIGARLLHVIDFWDDIYRYNPARIVQFWGGGIAIFGAYLGGFAGGATYITLRNKPWLHRLCDNVALRWTGMHRPFPEVPSVAHLADIAAPALLIALAIGRIGDVINGEHWSSFSTLPWAWVYTDPDSLGYGRPASHPAVAYELIFCLILAGILWLLRDRIVPRGMLFALFFAGYSAGRFFISFLRQEQNTYIFGFNEAQLVALAVMLVTVPLLIYRARLVRRRPASRPRR